MKIKYLIAGMLACLMSFSSCGSDDDPTPDKPDDNGTEKPGSKTMILNVEKGSTLKQVFDEQISKFQVTYDNYGMETAEFHLDTIIAKGNLTIEDINFLNNLDRYLYEVTEAHNVIWEVTDVENIFGQGDPSPILDLSETQFVESTLWGETYLANHLYPEAGELTNRFFVIFPKNIEVIEEEALEYKYIYDITNLLGECLQEIGESAFANAQFPQKEEENGLELVFPSSLKKIGSNAFYETPLKKATTSNNATLEPGAFGNRIEILELNGVEEICTSFASSELSLTTVYMQDVKYIGERAFWGCYNLETVSMPHIEYIEKEAFGQTTTNDNRSNLEIKAEDLKNLKKIGDYAFKGINKMPDLSLATNLIKIGDQPFSNSDPKRPEIIIPQNVKEWGYNLGEFKIAHIYPKLPPLYEGDLELPYYSTAIYCDTLYVPKGCKNIYMEGAKNPRPPLPNILLSCGIEVATGIILEE